MNSTTLTVTKLQLAVDARFTNYSRCNVVNASYTCQCPSLPCPLNVGRTTVREMFLQSRLPPAADAPAWQWWRWNIANKTGGVWYSTLAQGQCSIPAAKECYWYVKNVVKRIDKRCSDRVIASAVTRDNPDCFNQCPQPNNSSSVCWIGCFYETVLGPGSGTGPLQSFSSGMSLQRVLDAFEKPFTTSNVSEGGCPAV